jgi:hypothetical protein
VFAAESALLRTKKLIAKAGTDKAANAIDMTQVYVREAFDRVDGHAKEALATMETGDTLRTQLSVLKKLTRAGAFDTVAVKRRIAARVTQGEKYIV